MSIYSDSGYSDSERKTHREIKDALDRARNRHLVHDKRGNVICSDYELAAVDYDGRTKWTKALCDEFEKRFGLPKSEVHFFWFCLVHTGCMDRFKSTYYRRHPEGCIKYYRRGLRDLNYVAMLEPSIYVSCSKVAPPALQRVYEFEPVASWHIHGVAWGKDRQAMRDHFNAVEESGAYVPIATNLKGCWARFIPPELVGSKLAYMNKTPRKVNRIWCKNPRDLNRNFQFNQREEFCRPGEHVQYFSLLSKYTMDELSLAGGEGSDILRTIKAPFLLRTRS